MIPFLFFLLFLLVWGAVSYLLTNRAMKTRWTRAQPAEVAAGLRRRNRGVLVATVAGLVIAALFEALIPAVSDAIFALQDNVAYALNTAPAWIARVGAGTVSWGFYLAILFGTLAGLVIGTLAAVKRYPILSGLSARDLF